MIDHEQQAIEAIARIIAPQRWAVYDSYLASLLNKFKGESIGYDPMQFTDLESINLATAALASLKSSGYKYVPEGFVAVPIEPTKMMVNRCNSAMKNFIRTMPKDERDRRGFPGVCGKHGYRVPPAEKARIRYRAMIEAAKDE